MSARTPLRAQALYYLVTGAWPVVHMRSFEAVSGRKTDKWLVRTFRALTFVIGVALWRSARARPSAETALLATGVAGALGAFETFYVALRRISPVYLGDAVLEAAFVLWRRRAH